MSLYAFLQMYDAGRRTNAESFARIRYVLTTTSPTDSVMDGVTGWGVFRPHAYFYYYLNLGIGMMLTDSHRRALLDDLRAGRVAPKLVILDRHLRAFSGAITEFIERHYEPTVHRNIWRRRPNAARSKEGAASGTPSFADARPDRYSKGDGG